MAAAVHRPAWEPPEPRELPDLRRRLVAYTPSMPSRPAGAGGAGRQYSCRWPVRPHRRHQCMNPRSHADGTCEHEDRIIPAHIRGPAGAPLRTGETVHLWDRQPGGEA